MFLARISGEVVLGSFGVCIGYKNPVPGDVSRSLDAYSGVGKARAAKNEVASIYEFALEGDSAFWHYRLLSDGQVTQLPALLPT